MGCVTKNEQTSRREVKLNPSEPGSPVRPASPSGPSVGSHSEMGWGPSTGTSHTCVSPQHCLLAQLSGSTWLSLLCLCERSPTTIPSTRPLATQPRPAPRLRLPRAALHVEHHSIISQNSSSPIPSYTLQWMPQLFEGENKPQPRNPQAASWITTLPAPPCSSTWVRSHPPAPRSPRFPF